MTKKLKFDPKHVYASEHYAPWVCDHFIDAARSLSAALTRQKSIEMAEASAMPSPGYFRAVHRVAGNPVYESTRYLAAWLADYERAEGDTGAKSHPFARNRDHCGVVQEVERFATTLLTLTRAARAEFARRDRALDRIDPILWSGDDE
ncbi:MAG: hypothetical protein HIU90_07430 [Proteobacteria bacterium]|nr:hypothetical protein [Pseudomonadota bacterium]